MPKSPTLSDAEWDVMGVIWGGPPVTAAEVIDRLAGHRNWNHRTVRTLLNRLVKKGALGYEAQGNRYLYRPLFSREACARGETRSFLSRVFGGAAGPMLVHFVNELPLSREEVEALRQSLDRKLGQGTKDAKGAKER